MEREIPLFTVEGVQDAEVSTHWFWTEDKLGLSLTRFCRGAPEDASEAVLIIHGLTSSTDMFIMPEHDNLVSYLLDHGYRDVWCLDSRMSNRHSYNLFPHRYTMDDLALYDYPLALAELRRHVGDKPLHVICHCLGANSFVMSLFAKVIDGVSSVIANSVALTPRVPRWSRVKLRAAPALVDYVLGVPYLNPRWGEDPGLTRGKLVSQAISLVHSECDVPACHLLSFMWGTGRPALYNHRNLAERTHRRVGDLLGATSMNYYRHVRKMVQAGGAVKYSQDPRYHQLPEDYFQYAHEIETPVLFMTGDQNRIFADSNVVCHQRLERIVPGRHELHVFPGYGHLDPFIGERVADEVFPRLLEFIEKHRQDAPQRFERVAVPGAERGQHAGRPDPGHQPSRVPGSH